MYDTIKSNFIKSVNPSLMSNSAKFQNFETKLFSGNYQNPTFVEEHAQTGTVNIFVSRSEHEISPENLAMNKQPWTPQF